MPFLSSHGRLMRRLLATVLGTALLCCVLVTLLQGAPYISRDGVWASEALAQPLPLRLFPSVGHWALNGTIPQLSGNAGGTVAYVKFLADGQVIEEVANGKGSDAPACGRVEREAGCVVWVPRNQPHPAFREEAKAAATKEGRARTKNGALRSEEEDVRGGAAIAQFASSSPAARTESPLTKMWLTLQTSTAMGATAYEIAAVSRWNETETASRINVRSSLSSSSAAKSEMTATANRWVSFGLRRRYGKAVLQRIYPVESGRSEGADARVEDRDRWSHNAQERRRSGFGPAVSYFNSELNSTDAVRLFADLYRRHVKRQSETEEKATKKQKADATGTTTAPPSAAMKAPDFSEIFDEQCFWLAEVVYHDWNNPSGTSEGRAWSTCGDRITWAADATTYESLLLRANVLACVVFFITGVPIVLGTVHQIMWMKDSRTRVLRVNPYQLIATAFMLALSNYMVSTGVSQAPSPASGVINRSKTVYLLYSVSLIGEWILFIMYFSVDREFTNYFQASESARQEASRRIIIFFLMIWVAPAIVVGVGGLHNPWIAGILASFFWLPQYIHCFTMDGWTGLTAPFILANWSLVLVPLLAPLLAPRPWTLPRSHIIAASVGAAVFTLQGGLLLALRLKEGRSLLPPWMAPWRHRYTTTVEAQRAALLESPTCPICRNPLEEGWDEHDELWRTPCNHLYHKSCLLRWMQERTECPLCRKLLPEP